MSHPSLRAGALLAAGSLAVHELRFGLGFGGADAVAGHGYLAWVAPLVALALAAACGTWIARIGRGGAGPATTLTWLGATASLLLVYGVQETIETLAVAGHPGLLAGAGWTVGPIAAAVGALVTLLQRGARAADRAAVRAARPWTTGPALAASPLALCLPVAVRIEPRRRVLARRRAGRAPPSVS